MLFTDTNFFCKIGNYHLNTTNGNEKFDIFRFQRWRYEITCDFLFICESTEIERSISSSWSYSISQH